MPKKIVASFVGLMALISVSGCNGNGRDGGGLFGWLNGGGQQSINMTISANPDLTTFMRTVEMTGLDEMLNRRGPYTVFVPTNEAFEKLGRKLDELTLEENRDQLATILRYHIVPDELTSEMLNSYDSLDTLNGSKLSLTKMGNIYVVNGSEIIQADVNATNGVIHVIDRVLVPDNTSSSGR